MSEQKCTVSSCCCGCTLRTGAMCTAIYCLVSSVINLVLTIVNIFDKHDNKGWFNVVVNVFTFIVAVVLFHAVRTEKPRLMHIWVYVQIVLLILGLIAIIVVSLGSLNIAVLVIGIAMILLMFYFIIIVRSYAIQVESGSGGGTNTV